MKITRFKIETNGNVKIIDVTGAGASCHEATQDIEKLLGTVDESSRQLTESYYQTVDPLVLKNENQN